MQGDSLFAITHRSLLPDNFYFRAGEALRTAMHSNNTSRGHLCRYVHAATRVAGIVSTTTRGHASNTNSNGLITSIMLGLGDSPSPPTAPLCLPHPAPFLHSLLSTPRGLLLPMTLVHLQNSLYVTMFLCNQVYPR